MNIVISGSMAFDRMLRFPDHFHRNLLPEELHHVNVCFVAPEMRLDFGGCAGNIAYNLKLLGEEKNTFIVAALGKDGHTYRSHLSELGLVDQYIYHDHAQFSAQAFITTDNNGNQITTFHPGALVSARNVHISSLMNAAVGIVAPSEFTTMLQHAKEFHDLKTPFFFDPGQNLPLFTVENLKDMLNLAPWLILNDYECSLFCERTNMSVEQLAKSVEVLIVTHGAKGSTIYEKGKTLEIAAALAKSAKDPTGCGDAYRAGLLYGFVHQLGWKKSGQLASILGAIKIESHGGQNHAPSKDEIFARYEDTFNEKLM